MCLEMDILCLPTEILEYIWSTPILSHLEVIQLSAVCRKFHEISNLNNVWRQKLMQRWPYLVSYFPPGSSVRWREEFSRRHECSLLIRLRVACMSAKFFQEEEISNTAWEDLQTRMSDDQSYGPLIIHELMSIIHDGHSDQNLTLKYYAEKMLRYVRQLHLKHKWYKFLELPEEQQMLEKGAIILAQWCQPGTDVEEDTILAELDDIADNVRDYIRLKQPDHPACRMQHAPGHLEESLMSPHLCRSALEFLNYHMYENLGFRGNEEDYYESLNSFIDKVLDRRLGIPISLSVVYMAVARRLGVKCEAVNFPNHFLIKFKEHPNLSEHESFTYIDVFNKGRFLSSVECLAMVGWPTTDVTNKDMFQAVPARKVIERMVRNLVHIGRQQGQMGDGLMSLRNAVELDLILNPNDLHTVILTARVYLHLRININQVLSMLKNQMELNPAAGDGPLGFLLHNAQMLRDQQLSEEDKPILPKYRSKHKRVHYSVGMVMYHKKYEYLCVISGWDERCEASHSWMNQMGVPSLQNQGKQPFYNVLVEDGSNRYAAQENLVMCESPKPIPHRDVGKYFAEFCGTHYLPNHEKCQQYPEDLDQTLVFVRNKYTQ